MTEKIPVGISECLLGHKVRHDGGHKRDKFITDKLAEYFEFRPFCPEMAAGLGVPREPIRLVDFSDEPDAERVRLCSSKDSARDFTEALIDASAATVAAANTELCGYILMKGSPSCGMERVKVYRDNGYAKHHSGTGVFARQLLRANPLLPVEESGRLNDPALRERFITRVFAHWDFKQRVARAEKFSALIDFYSDYKYLVMAHSVSAYKSIGPFLAEAHKLPLAEAIDEFGWRFFQALALQPNRKSHTNVLQHLQGYLKKRMSRAEKAALGDVIEQYRQGLLPLSVPVLMLRQLSVELECDYLKGQKYWVPFPEPLALRNYV